MSDDGPSPKTVEMHLHRVGIRPSRFESVYGPHGEVADQEKRHHFASGLASDLVAVSRVPPGGVKNKYSLHSSLNEARQGRQQNQNGVLVHGEVTADDAEHGEEVQARLGHHQQNVVEFDVAPRVKLELPHLEQRDDDGQGGHAIQR